MAATTTKPVKSAGKIPGSTLKIIAMVCMLIDHTAAVLFRPNPDFPRSSECGERFGRRRIISLYRKHSCDLLCGYDYARNRKDQFSDFLFSVD